MHIYQRYGDPDPTWMLPLSDLGQMKNWSNVLTPGGNKSKATTCSENKQGTYVYLHTAAEGSRIQANPYDVRGCGEM